jgi:hypothetical protein
MDEDDGSEEDDGSDGEAEAQARAESSTRVAGILLGDMEDGDGTNDADMLQDILEAQASPIVNNGTEVEATGAEAAAAPAELEAAAAPAEPEYTDF